MDAAYGKRVCKSDAERVAFLFDLYREYTSLLRDGGLVEAERKSAKKRRWVAGI